MKCIEVQDLWVRLADQPVLQGISFWVDEGENVVVSGASGAGKTVLLKTILGLLRPDQGRILIQGKDTAEFGRQDWIDSRRNIGMVFQGNALFDSITVWENVGFYLSEHTDFSPEKIRQEASRVLSLVGLEGTEDLSPDRLSGGMKKRVALARTLIFSPKVIFYDEPTAGLDPVTAASIATLILELQQKLGTATLIVTHDAFFALRVANRIGLLSEGKLSALAPVAEVRENRENPAHRFYSAAGIFANHETR